MRRRSSNWLQKGCRTVIPVLRLGIHPEMERPAILKRSMPSTAGVTIGIPPARVGHEADFQLQEEYTRRGAVCPGTFVPVLMSEGKCLHWRAKSAHLGGHLPRGTHSGCEGDVSGRGYTDSGLSHARDCGFYGRVNAKEPGSCVNRRLHFRGDAYSHKKVGIGLAGSQRNVVNVHRD